MGQINQRLKDTIETLAPELNELSEYIYNNPELGHEEYKSSLAHVKLLENHGFQVTYPYLGVETAFRASYDSGKPGPTASYLAEYDALEGIGHGCGHNLLGTTATGSGIALSKMVAETGGKVVVFGTPAEETNGEKVTFANEGAFDDVDVALSAHPGSAHYTSGTSMAMDAIEFRFYGRTAHAAQSPFEGRNALDAMINFYNLINAFRQQMESSARIHGVITDGGSVANVIPDYTRAEFYIRSQDLPYLNEIRERMIKMAQAAADGTGCRMEWGFYETSYKNLITNESLSQTYNDNMADLGIEIVDEDKGGFASMDMGDVSHVVPAISPFFGITNHRQLALHTVEFRDATLSDFAKESMKQTIYGLAKTGLDIITDKELLEEIQVEFSKIKQ